MGYYNNKKSVPFSDLLGKTLTSISGLQDGNDMVTFITSEGKKYEMQHYQDCCEGVSIEDVSGDVEDLLNTPILLAEEVENPEYEEEWLKSRKYTDSYTWTFYKLATIKGYVDIRWLGESNGYYSESVDFEEVVL